MQIFKRCLKQAYECLYTPTYVYYSNGRIINRDDFRSHPKSAVEN
jgi:hypothetical protein